MPVVYSRKEHVCHLCLRRIPKGHRYWRTQEKVNGEWQITKEHTNCELYTKEPKQGEF